MTVKEASKLLGISPRSMYDLAAPNGPITCYRIGRSLRFDESDVLEYRRKCQYTEIKREVATFLSSTAALKAEGSGLEKYFRKHGRAPRLTPMTAKNQADSTPLRLVSSGTDTR